MTIMRNQPTFSATVSAIFMGHLPKVMQPRGWVLAGLTLPPYILALLSLLFDNTPAPTKTALEMYHYAYAQMVVPLLALIAASAGIGEDLEQRTLPLMLVRPAPVWALPLAKGSIWLAWCSVWLAIVIAGLFPPIGLDIATVPNKLLALLLTFCAQLGFATFFILVFKRGILWAALFFFVWEPFVRVFPPALQRATFTHYLESLARSHYSQGDSLGIFAQTQVTSPAWLSIIVLVAIAILAWAACGYWLLRKPIGLSGQESEG
jgi:ABC-type transport system involved in multi-copper enzyme maturation permease subunit